MWHITESAPASAILDFDQSTHARVANPTTASDRHGPRALSPAFRLQPCVGERGEDDMPLPAGERAALEGKSSLWPVEILAAEAERTRTTPRRSVGRPGAARRQASGARPR